ncbi:hypothetical protein [Pseudomonas sp. G5(2012)]|uniref:hypothetical protein n=1 Tax=Pseudomonas sp. G5(2012) TaxID=1268068 RepID=UPI0003432453|nr:hypothetical protein [Pseudomonas sp. G5(2012)]EPA95527.1 hypothetical protein PG5_40380 [Pseudomonas sp. G5(2012)]
MANDLDIRDPGGLAPNVPSQPLAPAPDWGSVPDTLTPEIADNQNSSDQLQLFGAAIPGATPQQVNQTLNEIQAVIAGDLMRLGHPQSSINAAIVWFQNNARKSPQREAKRHSYNLHDQAGDLVAESFGNAMAKAGASQEFISNCLWLLGELNKRLGTQPAQGRATPTTSSGRPDDLSDAEYNALYDYNEKMKPRTEGILRDKWGNAYEANRRMVDDYLQSLSDVEKRHFDKFLNNGLHALNDPTVILGLWGQAVGVNNIPRGGAELAHEINLMHDAMKNNRKQWLADERMQSRYRELIRIRDGG